jgi:hypothetical protein
VGGKPPARRHGPELDDTAIAEDRRLSAVFHNYGDVFSGQAARLISLALSLDSKSARSTRVNAH